MPNTLSLTVEVLTKNAKDIDKLIDRVEELGGTAGTTAPKTEKLGGGINAATLAAGAAALAVGALTGAVGSYVKSAIDAAARTEGLRNGLRVVIPDAGEFEATLARIDKQARLPGLQKNDLVKFTTNMRAAGLDAGQTESALTILGSRIVGFGQTSAEAASVVSQFNQAMSRGRIEGDELNRLFESLPGFKNVVTEMTGVTGGAQDLNDAFAAQGLTVQEGLIPLLEAYDASLGEINHDAALVKADAFEGSLEDLRNTIGEKLLPIYKDFLDRGAEIADNIAALVTGAGQLPQPLLDIKEAFENQLEAVKPLIEPLENLGNAILPLLKTIWNELVGIFVDFVLPTITKLTAALAPFYASLINLTTPIANLIRTYLPPLVEFLKTLAGIIVDIVLVPIRELAGAFGWVIDQITKLINLIPGAKTELETTATASDDAAIAAGKQATATEGVTDAVKAQKTEVAAATAANLKFSDQAATAATKQTELKVAVAASNIELKNAKQALKDATNPEEIEAASKRVETAIEAVKNAKVAEAQTFDDESKKQIAILKAESDAQTAHEKVVETASKNREKFAEDLTKKEEGAAKDRELAIENEVNALSTLITNYTQSTQTEFNTRTTAFTAYKNKRVALANEIIANVEASELTEAQKAAAIRKTHEDLAKDLSTEWGKITAAEKAELEKQKQQAEAEAKAKAEAIKTENEGILSQTEAYLIRSETAYKSSFDRSETEQEDAFDRLLVTLTAHHAAEIKAAEDQGKDTAVIEAKHDAEIEKLQDEHHKRLQKQNDAAASEENKKRKAALDELKSQQKGFFDAVDGATREFHSSQVSENKDFHLDFNAGAKEGLQVFKDAWQDILADVVDLGLQYLEDMKAINEIQLEAEQTKQELFAEMSEKYYEIEREAVEKLRGLAQERVKIYEDAKTAIQAALDAHGERLVDIEEDYNAKVIEINEDAVDQLREIGIDSNRDRLDDSLDFHAELESIENAAQLKREGAAEDHKKRLADIENERNKDLLGASRDFVGESLEAFEAFQSSLEQGDITDVIGAQNRLNETIGDQLQGIIRSVIGDEADSLFSVSDFDAFDFLGIRGSDLTSENFIDTLVSKLPGAIGRLREGELLQDTDIQRLAQADTLSQLLQGTSINESTGGILGAFRDAGATEDARYLEALDNIDQWEIAANEVILNTQSLIIQTGADRTTAEGASLTQRDDETQVIAEGHNQGQASITDQEIGIKQETRDTLNQLVVDYANQALTIDAETRAAIKTAQKQAADSFWKGVIEVGGTVLGVAAGAAISGLTGGAIPPNIAIGFGAQLGQAGGGLLAEAVVGGDDAEAGFHNPIHDHLAFLEGQRSGRAVSGQAGSSQRRQFYSQQAADFSGYFGRGFQGAFNSQTGGAGGQTGVGGFDFTEQFAEIVEKLQSNHIEQLTHIKEFLQKQKPARELESKTAKLQSEIAELESKTSKLSDSNAQELGKVIATFDGVVQELASIDLKGLFDLIEESQRISLKVISAIEAFPGILANELRGVFAGFFSQMLAIARKGSGSRDERSPERGRPRPTRKEETDEIEDDRVLGVIENAQKLLEKSQKTYEMQVVSPEDMAVSETLKEIVSENILEKRQRLLPGFKEGAALDPKMIADGIGMALKESPDFQEIVELDPEITADLMPAVSQGGSYGSISITAGSVSVSGPINPGAQPVEIDPETGQKIEVEVKQTTA